MKNIAIRLLFVVVGIVAFNACKDKDDLKPLRYLSSFNINGTDKYDFTYDGDGVLIARTRKNSNTVLTYEYGENGKLVRLKSNGYQSNVFTHSGNVIVKQDQYVADGSGKIVYTNEYSYDNKDRLIQRKAFSYTAEDEPYQTVTIKFAYSDDSNNVSKISFFNPDETTAYQTVDYTYGTQKYAFALFPPEVLKYQKLDYPYENAITKINFSDATEVNVVCDYNSDGYPTRQIETHSSGSILFYTITYTCN